MCLKQVLQNYFIYLKSTWHYNLEDQHLYQSDAFLLRSGITIKELNAKNHICITRYQMYTTQIVSGIVMSF